MINVTIEENENEPVITNVETTSVQNVPFPAITIRADTRYENSTILHISKYF